MLIRRCLLACAFLCGISAFAQDPFEIHVYEYETLARGQATFETHLNYVSLGTRVFNGTVAPTNNQFHMTFEVTAGITDQISIGVMQLNGVRPGGSGLEYAGWRLLPHFYAPESWHLPVKLGLVTEFSFQRTQYEENSRRVEVRPIVEKSWGRYQLDFNPVFERALHGPGVRDGWNFEPAGRVAYEAEGRFSPSLEYYSSWGPLPDFLPVRQQFHQILPGGDIKLNERAIVSIGVGVAITPAGSRVVLKTRVEITFGHKHV